MFSNEPCWQCAMQVPFRLYRNGHKDEIWCCSMKSSFVDWDIFNEKESISGWIFAIEWGARMLLALILFDDSHFGRLQYWKYAY